VSGSVNVIAMGAVLALLILNLAMTLRLAERCDGGAERRTGPVAGSRLAAVDVRGFDGVAMDWREVTKTPFVLAFLSAQCQACRTALPRLLAAARHARGAGVPIRVVALSAAGELDQELETGDLDADRLILDRSALKQLNPANAAPYYLFVGQGGVLQAAGYIGDADWRAFERQLGVEA
jgi:hypothetical protein